MNPACSGAEPRVALRDARGELGEARVLARDQGLAQFVEPLCEARGRLRRLRARQADALEVHERADARRPHARVDHRDVRAHAVADDARGAARAERVEHRPRGPRSSPGTSSRRGCARCAPKPRQSIASSGRPGSIASATNWKVAAQSAKPCSRSTGSSESGPQRMKWCVEAADRDRPVPPRAQGPVAHRITPTRGAGPAACRCAGRRGPRPRTAAAPAEALAGRRQVAELREHEAGERRVVVARAHAARAEQPLDVVDRHAAVHEPGGVVARDRLRGLLVRGLGQFAGDRGQDVGGRDHAFDRAVLVHDHGEVHLRLAEQLEQPQDARRLVHDERRLHARGELARLRVAEPLGELAGHDDAEQLVELAAAHGIARVAAGAHHVPDRLAAVAPRRARRRRRAAS